MNFNQIIADLKKKVYHPVYFLTGDEPYFIDTIADYIEQHILDDTEKEFNQTVLYGRDTDLMSVLATAKRFPMMANYQVVIIKEAQNLRELNKSSTSIDPFINYLKQPQKSTILVFCYKYKKVDKRTSLGKSLSKNTIFFESQKLYDNKIPKWIDEFLKERGYIISPKASMLLTEYLGTNLSKIVNELNKLMINIPEKSEITLEDIQNNIGISKDYNIFELQNAIGKRDVLAANRIINYFAANPKDNPLVVTLSSLYNYFTKILLYHSLADKSRNNAASVLGVHPYFLGDYEKAAKQYNIGKLKHIFSHLKETDAKSKGVENVSTTEGNLLKELIFKIMH